MNRFLVMWLVLLSMVAGLSTVLAQDTEQKDEIVEPVGATVEKVHAPRITCAKPKFEFGERDSTESVEHTFTVKNDGDLTLVISRARPSCGCTVANISNKEVPPGETAEIKTKLSLKGRSGKQRKNIRVESNDPATPSLMLYLEGTAVNNLEVKPNNVYFGRASQSNAASATIDISARTDLDVTGVTSSADFFTATIEEVEKKRKFKVLVETTPPLELGNLQGEVRVTRSNGPDIVVPVSAMVVGPLAVAPRQIMLDRERVVSRIIIIRPNEVKEFEVTSVEIPHEQIKSAVMPLGSNGYRIQLDNIPPDAELDGKTVVITTDSDKMPRIEIPFKAPPQ